jgi:serine/threonine-protein kinase
VRVTPQLIRVSDDTHLWSDRYDAFLADIFQVQSDIAQQVAEALDIALLEPERRALASEPTENIEAYEYYLRGNEYYFQTFLEDDFRIAIGMYEKAIELDPTFALAHAQLSRGHVMMYWIPLIPSEEHLAMAKDAVDKALELAPDLPEAHLALGHYYYHGNLDYGRALEQFEIARKSLHNNSELLSFIGFVQRRQGKFEQGLANIKKASELDPRSAKLTFEVGTTLMLLRKYPEAEPYHDRAIALGPDWLLFHGKVRLYLIWEGSTEKARAVLEEAAAQNIKSAELSYMAAELDVYDGNYQEALDKLSLKSEDIGSMTEFIVKTLRKAFIYGYMSKEELAKKCYDDARRVLETTIQQQPKNELLHLGLGIAYAGLGRKEDAIREAELAVELLPISKDAIAGSLLVKELVRIYVMVGEFDAAIDQLEYLLSIPSELSIPLLRLDPVWDPLRDHPRFKRLLEGGSK